jgi:hypothetical protein
MAINQAVRKLDWAVAQVTLSDKAGKIVKWDGAPMLRIGSGREVINIFD